MFRPIPRFLQGENDYDTKVNWRKHKGSGAEVLTSQLSTNISASIFVSENGYLVIQHKKIDIS